MAKERNPAAELAKKRWEGVEKEERSELMTSAVKSRWERMSPEERKAEGARLAAARAKKRAAVKKPKAEK
jgi:hypothetical protein